MVPPGSTKQHHKHQSWCQGIMEQSWVVVMEFLRIWTSRLCFVLFIWPVFAVLVIYSLNLLTQTLQFKILENTECIVVIIYYPANPYKHYCRLDVKITLHLGSKFVVTCCPLRGDWVWALMKLHWFMVCPSAWMVNSLLQIEMETKRLAVHVVIQVQVTISPCR